MRWLSWPCPVLAVIEDWTKVKELCRCDKHNLIVLTGGRVRGFYLRWLRWTQRATTPYLGTRGGASSNLSPPDAETHTLTTLLHCLSLPLPVCSWGVSLFQNKMCELGWERVRRDQWFLMFFVVFHVLYEAWFESHNNISEEMPAPML